MNQMKTQWCSHFKHILLSAAIHLLNTLGEYRTTLWADREAKVQRGGTLDWVTASDEIMWAGEH